MRLSEIFGNETLIPCNNSRFLNKPPLSEEVVKGKEQRAVQSEIQKRRWVRARSADQSSEEKVGQPTRQGVVDTLARVEQEADRRFTERSTTKYYQVLQRFRGEVLHGGYVGELPSMDKLAIRYGISRVTMKNVLKKLEREGLVSIRQGSGTFVNQRGIESLTSKEPGERLELLPTTFLEALERYRAFFADSNIDKIIKARMVTIIDAQIKLVTDAQRKDP